MAEKTSREIYEEQEDIFLIRFFIEFLENHSFISTKNLTTLFFRINPVKLSNPNSIKSFKLRISNKIRGYIKKGKKLGYLEEYSRHVFKIVHQDQKPKVEQFKPSWKRYASVEIPFHLNESQLYKVWTSLFERSD